VSMWLEETARGGCRPGAARCRWGAREAEQT
jgi:hypothetical protein